MGYERYDLHHGGEEMWRYQYSHWQDWRNEGPQWLEYSMAQRHDWRSEAATGRVSGTSAWYATQQEWWASASPEQSNGKRDWNSTRSAEKDGKAKGKAPDK